MHVKKLMGVVAVLAVTMFGTGARAEEPTPETVRTATPDETLNLKKGEVRKMELKDVVRIAVGDPEIANIDMGGEKESHFRITGSKKGETMLLVWKKDGSRRAYRLVIQG